MYRHLTCCLSCRVICPLASTPEQVVVLLFLLLAVLLLISGVRSGLQLVLKRCNEVWCLKPGLTKPFLCTLPALPSSRASAYHTCPFSLAPGPFSPLRQLFPRMFQVLVFMYSTASNHSTHSGLLLSFALCWFLLLLIFVISSHFWHGLKVRWLITYTDFGFLFGSPATSSLTSSSWKPDICKGCL